jgi:hypothetical protein
MSLATAELPDDPAALRTFALACQSELKAAETAVPTRLSSPLTVRQCSLAPAFSLAFAPSSFSSWARRSALLVAAGVAAERVGCLVGELRKSG